MRSRQGKGGYDNCVTCGQVVLWITMQESGANHPLDPSPSSRGTIAIVGGNKGVVVPIDQRKRAIDAGRALYVSHFATCQVPMRRSVSPAVRAHLRRVMDSLGTDQSASQPQPEPTPPLTIGNREARSEEPQRVLFEELR